MRHEFWSVVEPDKRWGLAPLEGEAGEGSNKAFGVNGVIDHDRLAFACVFVDDVQQLDLLSVDHLVELEVHGPQGVRSDEAHRPDAGADPGEAFLLASGWHAESFLAPQAAPTPVVDRVAVVAKVSGRAAPPPAGTVFAELAQMGPDLGVVISWDGRGQSLG